MTPLEDFFRFDVWKPEYDRLEDEALDAALTVPWQAMKVVWSQSCQSQLRDTFGKNKAYFNSKARKIAGEIYRDAMENHGLTGYQAALVRLTIESLLTPNGDRLFPVADDSTRRRWVEAFCPPPSDGVDGTPDFSAILGINPKRVFRMATARPALVLRKGIRESVIASIMGAAHEAMGGEVDPWSLRVRLVAIRFWLVTDEGEEAAAAVGKMLGLLGTSPEEIRKLIDGIREEKLIEAFATPVGESADLDAAIGYDQIRESIEFYGFDFNAKALEFQRVLQLEIDSIEDPWIRTVYLAAMESDALESPHVEFLLGLGSDRQTARAASMRYVLEQRLFEHSRLIEIRSEEIAADPGSLSIRVFDALLGMCLSENRASAEAVAQDAGLAEWFGATMFAYETGPAPVVLPPFEEADLDAFASRVGIWKRIPAFEGFVEEIQRDVAEHAASIARQDAFEGGRGWFFGYVLAVEGDAATGFDQGRLILTTDDERFLREVVGALRSGDTKWWSTSLDPARELRFAESAARLGIGEDTAEVLDAAAEFAVLSIRNICVDLNQSRLNRELEACWRQVTLGEGQPKEQLLRSFRSIDASGFREQLDPPHVELPGKSRRSGTFDLRTKLYVAVLLTLISLFLIRNDFFTSVGSTQPKVADATPIDFQTLVPSQEGWQELGSGLGSERKLILTLGSRERDLLFGDFSQQESLRGDSVAVEFEVAGEFLRRYRAWIEGKYLGGVDFTGAIVDWESIRSRLPEPQDRIEDQTPRPYWISDGVLAGEGSVEPESTIRLGDVHVIFEVIQ
ncbi:hypothetical protein OAR33_00205 [bacterium]|nr:hypothetical protein [bacterium]MDC0991975.1 hypothetical protein [bacterium]